MQAGQLNDRVTFQRATLTSNAFGEPLQAWANVGTVWARVEPIAGKERFSAMQTMADVDYRITFRYQPALSDLGPDDRAQWDGKSLDIKAVYRKEGRSGEMHAFARLHL